MPDVNVPVAGEWPAQSAFQVMSMRIRIEFDNAGHKSSACFTITQIEVPTLTATDVKRPPLVLGKKRKHFDFHNYKLYFDYETVLHFLDSPGRMSLQALHEPTLSPRSHANYEHLRRDRGSSTPKA